MDCLFWLSSEYGYIKYCCFYVGCYFAILLFLITELEMAACCSYFHCFS